MAFQVMHTHHRLAQTGGQRASHAGAHQQRTGQPRATRVGHNVHLRQSAASLTHHLSNQRQHAANMVTAGELRHHAAIGLVHLDLAVQGVRKQHRHACARGIYQRHAGFIARRLHAQHQSGGGAARGRSGGESGGGKGHRGDQV